MGSSQRLLSLDALRGFTVMAMVVVNSPGSWSHVYSPLLHASWNGATPTDLVFPFFLFASGVAIALAFQSRIETKEAKRSAYRKICSRAAKLFLVGLFLNLWPNFDFSEIRIAGVLQRIAIVFAVCGILFLNTNWKQLAAVLLGILLGYWMLLGLVPVPRDAIVDEALKTGYIERSYGSQVEVSPTARNEETIEANLEPGTNLAAWVDRAILPGRMWEVTWDPEGVLSTLPSIASGLCGLLVGILIQRIGRGYRCISWVFFVGLAALLVSVCWSWVFPFNKNLWSSSFVLYSSGLATLILAALMLLVDELDKKSWALPGIIFGSNALLAYALSGMLTLVFYSGFGPVPSMSAWFMDTLVSIGVEAKFASLIYALLYLAMLFIPIWLLWRKRVFIRL